MNTAQRAKLSAGVGIIAMLFGALMVIAPGAGAVIWDGSEGQPPLDEGGNLNCTTLDPSFTVEAKNESGATSGNIGGAEGFDVDFELLQGTVEITVLPGSRPVHAVVIKTGNASSEASNGHLSYEVFEPPVVGAEPDGTVRSIDYSGTAISNIKVCGPAGPSLTVTKQVAESEQEFTITVTPTDGAPVADDLGDDDSITIPDASGDYAIVETLPAGWQEPVIDCGQAETNVEAAAGFTVTVGEVDVVCTVTNTPQDEPDEPELTVRKVVTGANAPSPWDFDFTLCDDIGEQPELQAQRSEIEPQLIACDFTLLNDTGDNEDEKTFPAGEYDITEIDDANLSSIVCTDDEGPTGTIDLEGSTASVVVSESDVTCVFTNNFPGQTTTVITTPPTTQPEPELASLRVVKEVTGPGDIPDTWTVDFEIASLGDTVREFALNQTIGMAPTGGLTDGSYTVTETVPSGDESSLTDVDCLDAEGAAVTSSLDERTLTVALDEGDDVTCTFINSYPEVLDTEVTVAPTEETVAPTTTAAPEVKGDTVVRTLPRTGSGTTSLAGFGALLLAAGAALVISANRRQANIH